MQSRHHGMHKDAQDLTLPDLLTSFPRLRLAAQVLVFTLPILTGPDCLPPL